MKKRQVVITGAGACGLMAAIMAATMNVYNHIAEKSHVENEMSKMNLPETEQPSRFSNRMRNRAVRSA